MKKGFTLIELLAVIVVLAILALVVTPIVLNIVEKAQKGSDERSLEQYAKVVQSTFYELKIKDPSLTLEEYLSKVDTEGGIKLKYNGSKVVCSEKKVVETVSGTQTIELRNCTVDGRGPYDFINGIAGNKNNSNVPAPKSFSEDSWSTIIANVKKGNTSAYKVGDTKEITLTSTDTEIAGTYTVRIANMSTPTECGTEGFSQTACGFVIEFVDIITMRSSISDIHSALPSEIQAALSNYLYLLSSTEVFGSTSSVTTRQLDYYAQGVTTNNSSAAIKQYNGIDTEWWLKDSTYVIHSPGSFYVYFYVSSKGSFSGGGHDTDRGVSPAFRIEDNNTITTNLTDVLIDNSATYIEYGESYNATLTSTTEYGLDIVKVTMDGTDITSSAYKNGKITIDSVTGKIIITATSITNFAGDSWSTVISNVKKGNTSAYKVGDIKKVTLTSTDKNIAGTYKVRIANKSTPSECNTTGFSQTACGFVIEFVDIISKHNMNPSGEYKGTSYSYGWNKDGWPASEMYTYVNNDIYNALPSEVKAGIIDTYTISGYGENDSPNKTSTDKLYLLSTAEIWAQGTSSPINYDTARDVTRQLDYYEGITTNNYSKAIKQYNGSDSFWWLRSAGSDATFYFYYVQHDGDLDGSSADSTYGVSPAFRIG